MHTSVTTVLLYSAVLLAGSMTLCHAQEPASLPDITNPGQWRIYQYNKARGRLAVRPEFPSRIKDGAAAQRQSLGIKIDWQAGGDFQFFTIEPTVPLKPVPFTATELRAWVHGSGTAHSLEAHFTDADGKEVKVGLGGTSVRGWRPLTARIPTEWKQPLTFRNVTFHNWAYREAVAITTYLTRLELLDANNATTALLLSPAAAKAPQETAVPVSGTARTVSDMNLPGEWRIPPKSLRGGTLSLTEAFPADVKTDPDLVRQSLQVSIHFPGSDVADGFNTFHVEPVRSIPVPYQMIEARLWLKGTGTRHNFDLLFSDADGKNLSLAPTLGRLEFNGWQQMTAKVPGDWLQPLTFRGIGFYSWGIKEPANLNVSMSRLEFVIDPARPVKREESKTNDAW